MQTLRLAANTILFAGWLIPALAARFIAARLGSDAGVDAARMFNVIAAAWAFAAVVYAVVLAVRMRRGIAG